MVPNTVTEQGAVFGVPVAAHVAESLIPLTVIVVELIALTSAIPTPDVRLLISTIRKRNRVTGAPVLFWKRLLTDSVPGVKSGIEVKSRTRFGAAGAPIVESRSNAGIVRLTRALPRF